MDLEYILIGIPANATVSIIELTTEGPKSLISELPVNKINIDKRYEVVKLTKDVICDKIDYTLVVQLEH